MATTRGWALHGNIVHALNYILDIQNGQQKTEEGILVDWNGEHTFSPYSAGYSWQLQKMCAGSQSKSDTVGYHFQQSFEEGSISPEEALEISREWIDKITDGQCEYVLAVHTNTKNIHTHIIVNPIQKDGNLWNIYWKKDKLRFRDASDQICQSHGLNILEKTSKTGRSYFEWMKDQATDEPDTIKRVLEYLIPNVSSYEMLKQVLEKLGFSVRDGNNFRQDEVSNPHLFCFTVNAVLLEKNLIENPDHLPDEVCIRVPYTKDHFIFIPKECFTWIQPGVNARIVLPQDKTFRSIGFNEEILTIEDIKNSFRTEQQNRSGLRIKLPGGSRYLKTKFIDKSLSLESIEKRISSEQPDNTIKHLLSEKSFSNIQDLRRSIFDKAGVKLNYQGCASYVSQRQEAYYQALVKKCEKRRNMLSYHKLLMDDRKNLPTLLNRKAELLSEIDEINTAIKECELHIYELEADVLSETGCISNDQIESYIQENILPLRKQREKCRDLISMYSESIQRVQENSREKEYLDRS